MTKMFASMTNTLNEYVNADGGVGGSYQVCSPRVKPELSGIVPGLKSLGTMSELKDGSSSLASTSTGTSPHWEGYAQHEHLSPPSAAYPLHTPFHLRDLAVFLKDNKGLRRVMLSDMVYLEADGNYVEVHLRTGRVVLRNSMTEILKLLPEELFLLVNRSQAVNVLLVDGVGADEVTIGKRSFTLTRRYREGLLSQLPIIAGR